MLYLCLVHFDPARVFDASPEASAVLARSGPKRDEANLGDHFVMAQSLGDPANTMTVRIRDGRMSATDGPFLETKEVLGGFVMIEALDMNDAVRIAAQIPLAALGAIEVRPVHEFHQRGTRVSDN